MRKRIGSKCCQSNEIYFPCFYFISSGYAVRRIEFFFCLLRNESFLVIFFMLFCVSRFIVVFFFFFRQFSLENESGLLVSTELRIKKNVVEYLDNKLSKEATC